ncbi:hypothetical protein Kisp01_67270 [Kineosporia sp. NBRC 101677]|uniref:hypothetical protein n=1 Tax=Kineosporia sp. NBRC 101677 TaxID=3032197 RepID=UPI0024A4C36D|nr:hypothetical protein [Kineosporia sp. NBRC 101677]GLY19713.1 hypothetical protein Kisp01_67270 [Kineosporia sp. NBRC 101677]
MRRDDGQVQVRDDGQVQVIVYEPQKHSSAPMPRERSAPSSSIGSSGTRTPARVQAWKNALLDLSRSNRLIHCPESYTVALRVPTGQLGRLDRSRLSGHPV